MKMGDYIIRATAAQGYIRAFAGRTTGMVQEAQRLHGLSPVASAALGRSLTAAALLAIDMKDEKDVLSLIIKGNGPLGNIVVVATSQGRIKGYVDNPSVDLPLNPYGKLDVGKAVGGDGKLTVIKDLGLKEPYVGQVDLVSGEIGEDVANYLLISEQQPSAVAVGVLVNPDHSVKAAGGYIIQALPGASDEVIAGIEERILKAPSISSQIEQGKTPEQILHEILGQADMKVMGRIEPKFSCDCSRERLESVLISLGKEELEDIIRKEGKAELICHYCNKKYHFDKKELEILLKQAMKK